MAKLSTTGLSTRARGCYLGLISSASWKDHETRRGIQLKGQACASERWWADKWRMSQKWVHNLFVRFEKMDWIKRTADSRRNVGGTTIDVVVGWQPKTNFIRIERAALKQMDDEEWSVEQRYFWMDLAGLVAFSAGPDREVGTLTRTSRWLGERWGVDPKTATAFLQWLADSGWIEFKSADGFVRMAKGLKFAEAKTRRNAPHPTPQPSPQDSPQDFPQTSPQDFTYENRVGDTHNGTHIRTRNGTRVGTHNGTLSKECIEKGNNREECNPGKSKQQQNQATHASRAGLELPAAAARSAHIGSPTPDVQPFTRLTEERAIAPDDLGRVAEKQSLGDSEDTDQDQNAIIPDTLAAQNVPSTPIVSEDLRTVVPRVLKAAFLRRFTQPIHVDHETFDLRKDHDWDTLVWYLEGLTKGDIDGAEKGVGISFGSILKSESPHIWKRTPTFVAYCAQRACDPESKNVGAVFRTLLRTASDAEIPDEWWAFKLDPKGRIRWRDSEHPFILRRFLLQREARRALAIDDKPVLDAVDTTSYKAESAVRSCFSQLEIEIKRLRIMPCEIAFFLESAYFLGCDEVGRGILAWNSVAYPYNDLSMVPIWKAALNACDNPPLTFLPRIVLFDPDWTPPQHALERHRRLAREFYERLTGYNPHQSAHEPVANF